MKASALIRLAIDRFLAINDGSVEDSRNIASGEITPYICCALDRAARASGLSVNNQNNVLAQEVIADDINQYGTGGETTICVALNRLYLREHDHICGLTAQEVQEFRFMYADFLAHYFESIGN